MKVNIAGKGVIPFVNKVAPIYNIEVNAEILKKLVKNPKFKIYDANGFGQITAATFAPPAPVAPVEEPKVEEKPVEAPKPKKASKKAKNIDEVPGVVKEIVVEEKAPVAVEEPVEIEQVEEPVEMNEEVEAPAIEVPVEEEELEIPVEDTDFEEFPAEEEAEEATEETTEEAPKTTSKKKKKNRK